MALTRDLLVRTLRTPGASLSFSLSEWDMLVRQAWAAGLLARLAARFRHHGLTDMIPRAARWHFDAAETLAHKQQLAVRWELQQLHAARGPPRCTADRAQGRGLRCRRSARCGRADVQRHRHPVP